MGRGKSVTPSEQLLPQGPLVERCSVHPAALQFRYDEFRKVDVRRRGDNMAEVQAVCIRLG
jgi:hypothetical protein